MCTKDDNIFSRPCPTNKGNCPCQKSYSGFADALRSFDDDIEDDDIEDDDFCDTKDIDDEPIDDGSDEENVGTPIGCAIADLEPENKPHLQTTYDCNSLGLTTLLGVPDCVPGDFDCSFNFIETLKDGPTIVYGKYDCAGNCLTNLVGAPLIIAGDFFCDDNSDLHAFGPPPWPGFRPSGPPFDF